MAVPLIGYTTMLAFQYDFAYGTKANRIADIQRKILTEEADNYWFTPVNPTDEQMRAQAELENFRPHAEEKKK